MKQLEIIAMIVPEDIFDYAKLKGLQVDFYSEKFQPNYDGGFTEVYYPETHIVLQVNSYTWFWWTFDAKQDKPFMRFRQRYNAGSGHTIRSWKTGFNMEYKIYNFLDSQPL